MPRALCCVRRAEALAAMQDEAGVRALINEMPADLADKRLCVQHKEVSVGEHVRALADKIRHERKPIPDVAIESVIRSIEIPDTGRTQTHGRQRPLLQRENVAGRGYYRNDVPVREYALSRLLRREQGCAWFTNQA